MAEKFYHDLMEEVRNQFTAEEQAGLIIDLQTVQKQNHQELVGLTVRQTDSNVAPCFYMNEAKIRYEHGESMQVLAAEIKRAYLESLSLIPPAKMMEMDLRDYDKIKDQITMRLLDIRRNEAFLQDKPYQDAGNGLALTFDIRLKQQTGDFYSVTINNRMLEDLGCSKEDLMLQANENAWKINTPVFCSMQSKLTGGLFGDTSGNYLEDPHVISPQEKEAMYILSNEDMTMGAASLFVEPVQKQIAWLLNEGYYVLPSSIHEVLIVPESSDMDVQDICSMVREANRSVVNEPDVLSDFVYHYDPERDVLQTILSTREPYLLSMQDLKDPAFAVENRTDYEKALKTSVLGSMENAMESMYREGKSQVPFGRIVSDALRRTAEDPKLKESLDYCMQSAPSMKAKIEAGQLVTVDPEGIRKLQKTFRAELGLSGEREGSKHIHAVQDRDEEIA